MSGALVATLENFAGYQEREAQIWERLACLRARPIAGNEAFMHEAAELIARVAFRAHPPEREVCTEIDRLRSRAIEERAACGERQIDLKLGRGGLADIESVVQLMHLLHAHDHESLQRQNTFDVIDALGEAGLLDGETHEELSRGYFFLRKIISSLRLLSESSTNAIDTEGELAEAIAKKEGFESASALTEEIAGCRARVRSIYDRIICRA